MQGTIVQMLDEQEQLQNKEGEPNTHVPQLIASAPVEIEVKFRTDPLGQELALKSPLLGFPPEAKPLSLRSIYFDTPNFDLFRQGIVLRVRKTGRATPVMAVKFADLGAGGAFQRVEVETKIQGLRPNLMLLEPELRTKLSQIAGGAPLHAVFETQIKRRVSLVRVANLSVEVALDDGVVTTPEGLRRAICEIELELKSGDPADLYTFASQLAGELPLTLDFTSKSDKGFGLLKPENFAPSKAAQLMLDQQTSVDTALAAVITNTLGQFVGNWAALRQSDDPEAVHQLRVSLRRMRSAMKMFKRILPCRAFDELRSDAKRIASALGPARELDTFIIDAARGPMSYSARPPGCGALMDVAERNRAQAYRAARALIDDRETTLFVLKTQNFVARNAWRNDVGGGELRVLTLPTVQAASSMLEWLHRRVLKRGKRLTERSDEERHLLRIALKDLRYGAEFFGSTFGHSRHVRNLLKVVSELQELLGSHNDTVTTAKLVQGLGQGLGLEGAQASGYVVGWYAGGIPLADSRLSAAWKAFKKQRPFWH